MPPATIPARPVLLTITQAAAELTVSRWMIYQLMWSNQLRSVRIGPDPEKSRAVRIPRAEVDNYLAKLLDGDAA
jgi:excisionase family DNA binding protein